MSDETRARANQLAAPLVAVFRDGIGRSREEVDASLAAVEAEPRDQRLKAGLIKLLEDRATWGVTSDLEPELVRREVFTRATAARASLGPGERFDRGLVLAEVAKALRSDADVGRARALRRSACDERALRVRSGDPRRTGSSIRGRSGTSGALARGARGHRCASALRPAWRGRCFGDSNFSACSTAFARPRAATKFASMARSACSTR